MRPCISLIAGCAVLASIPVSFAQQPAWFNKVQFFAGAFVDYYVNARDPQTANAVPFTGEDWGYGAPDPTQESIYVREVSAWHALGRLYMRGSALNNGVPTQWGEPFPNSAAASCIDTYSNQNAGTQYSISNPDFQQYLQGQVKQAIDNGADGFQFDGAGDAPNSVLHDGAQAGCFDAATMAAFRAYLTNTYTASDLSARFGISDPSSFDYRQWIIQQGIQKTWNQQPLAGLAREFLVFRFAEEAAFLRRMTAFAHQYAAAQYGRVVTLSTNTAFDRFGPAYFDAADYFVNERGFLGSDRRSLFATADIKSYKGVRQWPVMAEPEVAEPPLTFPANLVRLAVSDIYASGATISAGKQPPLGPGQPAGILTPPDDPSGSGMGSAAIVSGVLRRYAQFILGHSALFENLHFSPQVAILDSTASRLAFIFPAASVPGVPGGIGSSDNDYYGTAQMLIGGNIQYDSVLAPDSIFSAMPSFTLQQLQKYKALVLPSTCELDDSQANTILDYVRGGGVVISDGRIGTNEPDGSLASRPDLLKLQSVEGATPYGNGVFVHTSNNLGPQYQTAENNGDNATKSALLKTFQSLISPYIAADVVTSPVTVVYKSGGGATAFLYQNPSNAFILHLVNYDYDASSDSYAPKDNVQVTVRVGSQPVDEVILWSPDISGPQSLPFSRSGDTVTFTVPHLEAWDILSLQQNVAAPVIQSAVPSQNIGAAGGTALNFSAQAQDPNGDPIAYTWTVNGQVVTDAFGPQFSYQVPESAGGGTYTVVVTVTDGSRITRNTWTVTVAGFRSPRVLFDETHQESYTIDRATAAQLNPSNPAVPWLGNLEVAMGAASFSFTRLTSGPISASVLSNIDVLILAAPNQAFTSAETQAIWTFVKNGGGLIFLGDHGLPLACNDLLAPFGLQLDNHAIFSADPAFPSGDVDVTSWVNHPALASATDFQSTPQAHFLTNYGGSFSVATPAVALGSTAASTWRGGIDANPVASPGGGLGPFVIVAASQMGSGRVFVIGNGSPLRNSPALYFSDTYRQEDQALFLSGLVWVSANANPAPSVTAGTAPKFSQAANAASYTPAISPGSWVSIFGQNLANTGAAGRSWSASDFQGNQLPTALAGTSVLINGRPAAISLASPLQLNVQAPDDTAVGQVGVEISTPFGMARGSASLTALAPGVFSVPGKGISYAAAVSAAGVVIAHPGDYAGARPAQPGETIEVFGTGFGPTTPPQPAGQLIQPALLAGVVTASLCGVPAEVAWAGAVMAGLDQINLTIPSSGVTGDCNVQFSIAGKLTQAGVSIPVQ